MPITFRCPKCNAAFRVADESAGKHSKCSKCGNDITIPGLTRIDSEPRARPVPTLIEPVGKTSTATENVESLVAPKRQKQPSANPTSQKKHSQVTYGALTTGVLLFIVGCVSHAQPNMTLGGLILDVIITAIVWFVTLGLLALIPTARGIKAWWLPTFAWLLLAAGVFEVAVGTYTRFVLEPEVEASIASIIDPAKDVIVAQPIEYKRSTFCLSYPATWSKVEGDGSYDQDHFIWFETPNGSFFQLFVFDPQVDASPIVNNLISVFRDKQMTSAASTSFSEWGVYRGKGIALRGKMMSIMPAEVRTFHAAEGVRPFVVVEMCPEKSRVVDQSGFEAIRKSLVLTSLGGN